MTFSNRLARKKVHLRKRLVAVLLVVFILGQLTPSQAQTLGERSRETAKIGLSLLINSMQSVFGSKRRTIKSQLMTQAFDPTKQVGLVRYIQLCPRKLVLYVGENFNLVPLPLDANKGVVQGIGFTWLVKDSRVASITSVGEVVAIAPGHTQTEVQAGSAKAKVNVEVRAGTRPKSTDRKKADEDAEREQARDCDDPLQDPPDQIGKAENLQPPASQELRHKSTSSASPQVIHSPSLRAISGVGAEMATSEERLVRLSDARLRRQPTKAISSRAPLASRAKNASFTASPASPIEPLPQGGVVYEWGDLPDITSISATAPFNAVGQPLYSPLECSQASVAKTKNNLGSSNYSFSASVLGLVGRGIGTGLEMSYNAQVWNKEANGGYSFNYQRGWPSTGWTLGYGKIIDDYDGAGNYLLIKPDGTRVHLTKTSATTAIANDGSYTTYNPNNGKLRYIDGTLVDFDLIPVNNRWLPKVIRTRNGDQITINYKEFKKNQPNPIDDFKVRWAIDTITDTLGRVIQFHYDAPSDKLISITTKDQGGVNDKVLCQIEYIDITLDYNFNIGALPPSVINAPPVGTVIPMVRRIYYPATGRGYVMEDYSSYGMARKISTRLGMTSSNDGTPIAYTRYDYPTVSSQVGGLIKPPEYTHRYEWWQDKIDGAAETTYTYTRSEESEEIAPGEFIFLDVRTVQHPNGLDVITKSDQNTGKVRRTEWKDGSIVLRKSEPTYIASGIETMLTTDESGNTKKTVYQYHAQYGRIQFIDEYGFSSTIQRRTKYSYSDDTGLIDQNLVRVITSVEIRNGPSQKIAKTTYEIDNYSTIPLEGYSGVNNVPNHDFSAYGTNGFTRGNITKTMTEITPGGATIDRKIKYDVFGNVVEADVSCCQVKTTTYNASNWFSQPVSVTDGKPGVVPFLTSSFTYDFSTSLMLTSTDPNSQPTTYTYDSDWRPLTMVSPTGAITTTEFDKNANGDLLSYVQKVSYQDDDPSNKIVTSRSWFDGAGRVLRVGTGEGNSPGSYDILKTEYDALGRVTRVSNPYLGNSSGIGTPSFWTSNTYDALSRVTIVTLPDSQTIQTIYGGAITTKIDQVNRRRSNQADGLGRLIKVFEQDPSTGAMSLVTDYSYDVLDNLLEVKQGNQKRTSAYDSLSRVTSQTTPESGTISYTYTDFGNVLKETDARGVETHYKYDSLNRLSKAWFTGLGGSDDPNATRPALPSGVAATSDVDLTYNTAAPGNGDIASVNDGQGIPGFSMSESYLYDNIGRMTSKTRTIDGFNYTTQYAQYNQASQLKMMIYPSGKRLRMKYDDRGRMRSEEKVDSNGVVQVAYASNMTYNVAGQLTAVKLGSEINETYSYSDDRLQLIQQKVMKGTETRMVLNYGYQAQAGESGAQTTAGNSGQLMSVSGDIYSQGRNQAFTYDNLGRLVTASNWNAINNRTFKYDRFGNRTEMRDGINGGNLIQNIVIAKTNFGSGLVENNKIQTVNGVSYTYNQTGDLTADGTHTYQYDAAHRLTKVDAGTTNEASYFYDSDNHRVKKVVGGVTTNYVWEGGLVIAEYSNGQPPPGAGGLKYYHADRLSTRLITNSSGAVIGTQDHLPFGEDAGTSGETEKHRFTNYERDESGTDYAVNRQYSNSTGRFLRPDPVPGDIGNPQSLNRYAYVQNDPINGIDPLGLEKWCWDKEAEEWYDCSDPIKLQGEACHWGSVPLGPGGQCVPVWAFLPGGGPGGLSHGYYYLPQPAWHLLPPGTSISVNGGQTSRITGLGSWEECMTMCLGDIGINLLLEAVTKFKIGAAMKATGSEFHPLQFLSGYEDEIPYSSGAFDFLNAAGNNFDNYMNMEHKDSYEQASKYAARKPSNFRGRQDIKAKKLLSMLQTSANIASFFGGLDMGNDIAECFLETCAGL